MKSHNWYEENEGRKEVACVSKQGRKNSPINIPERLHTYSICFLQANCGSTVEWAKRKNSIPPVFLSSGHKPYSFCLWTNRMTKLKTEQGHFKVWDIQCKGMERNECVPQAMVPSQDSDTNSYFWQPGIRRIRFPRVLKSVLIFTHIVWHREKQRKTQKQRERRKLRDPLFCTAVKANKRWNKTQNVKDCGKSAAQILSYNVSVPVWEGRP